MHSLDTICCYSPTILIFDPMTPKPKKMHTHTLTLTHTHTYTHTHAHTHIWTHTHTRTHMNTTIPTQAGRIFPSLACSEAPSCTCRCVLATLEGGRRSAGTRSRNCCQTFLLCHSQRRMRSQSWQAWPDHPLQTGQAQCWAVLPIQ